jgi:hypothetical protein
MSLRLLLLVALLAGWAHAQDPAACAPDGGLGYYRCRADDAERRRPGELPPSYYRGYGDRYARRFTDESRALLSPEGRGWLDRTRLALQVAMEARRAADPAAFAALERDEGRFLDFAYATHPGAYLATGLERLPLRDLVVIATTPDIQDILTPRGLSQVGHVLDGLLRACRADAASCVVDRVLIEARERRRLLADGLGLRPASQLALFWARRVVDSTLRALGVESPSAGLVRAVAPAR